MKKIMILLVAILFFSIPTFIDVTVLSAQSDTEEQKKKKKAFFGITGAMQKISDDIKKDIASDEGKKNGKEDGKKDGKKDGESILVIGSPKGSNPDNGNTGITVDEHDGTNKPGKGVPKNGDTPKGEDAPKPITGKPPLPGHVLSPEELEDNLQGLEGAADSGQPKGQGATDGAAPPKGESSTGNAPPSSGPSSGAKGNGAEAVTGKPPLPGHLLSPEDLGDNLQGLEDAAGGVPSKEGDNNQSNNKKKGKKGLLDGVGK